MATGYEISPRQMNNDGIKRVYRVEDAADEEALKSWLDANIAQELAGFPFSTFDAREIEDDETGRWEVTVDWGASSQASGIPSGTSSYRFNYTAPSARIKRSLATISVTGDDFFWFPDDPPEFGGLLHIADYGTADQHAEGMDLQPPPEVFSIPYADVPAVITPAYQAIIRGLCGKVNSTSFYGAAAGEIMLVRVNGERSGGLWNLDFGFGYIPNATSIVVSDGITVASKDGMDYLWALEVTTKDTASNSLVTLPAAAYVERVWERADLNLLNLPF